MEELGFDNFENSGVNYNELFHDSDSRKKAKLNQGNSSTYWTRTAKKDTIDNYYLIDGNGNNISYSAAINNTRAFTIGFCVGNYETLVWDALLLAIK